MRPIFTFTANIVAETTYYVSDWGPGQTSRAIGERFQVGGKGINVTKMLQRLGADSTAICFPGGDYGPMCERRLAENAITHKAFSRDCVTRSGFIARAPGEKEISLLGFDSQVSQNALHDCIEYLSAIAKPFLFAICGSVQDWDNPTWNALRDWLPTRGESIKLAVDTYGPGLKWFARQNPEILKINRDELETLFAENVSDTPTDQLLETVSKRYDCPLWVITNGDSPIHYLARDDTPKTVPPRPVDCRSPIGCGDVFFATLLDCLYNKSNYPLEKSIVLAAEYASRNAASPEIAEFELE